MEMKTRRSRCRNFQCERKVFAENLSEVAAPRTRETDRVTGTLRLVGYHLGGWPASRLLERLGMNVSRDTVQRRVKDWPSPESETKVRVLGVDDWVWRKHHTYEPY
jgi:hypothetical protein